jgi:hypothetical protein
VGQRICNDNFIYLPDRLVLLVPSLVIHTYLNMRLRYSRVKMDSMLGTKMIRPSVLCMNLRQQRQLDLFRSGQAFGVKVAGWEIIARLIRSAICPSV